MFIITHADEEYDNKNDDDEFFDLHKDKLKIEINALTDKQQIIDITKEVIIKLYGYTDDKTTTKSKKKKCTIV